MTAGSRRRLRDLRNLGPASERTLAAVGVVTAEDLERIGASEAFSRVRASGAHASLNLLWALEGALLDVDWRDLPPPVKEELLRATAPAVR